VLKVRLDDEGGRQVRHAARPGRWQRRRQGVDRVSKRQEAEVVGDSGGGGGRAEPRDEDRRQSSHTVAYEAGRTATSLEDAAQAVPVCETGLCTPLRGPQRPQVDMEAPDDPSLR
jgi:hypothetical protein